MMHYWELDKRLQDLLSKVGGVAEEINNLRGSPRIDEDYKLKWEENRKFTPEYFDELDRLAAELSSLWDR